MCEGNDSRDNAICNDEDAIQQRQQQAMSDYGTLKRFKTDQFVQLCRLNGCEKVVRTRVMGSCIGIDT